MIVVRMELWPGGNKERARPLGALTIINNGSGTEQAGNYDILACHAGKYWGKGKEPYKTGKVFDFPRRLSPYRLLCRALQAIRET